MIRASNLRQLQTRLTNSLDRLAGQLASGALTPSEFVVKADELLAFAHSRAAVLGSYRAKRTGDLDVANRVAAQARDEQRSFLFGFVRDLANGRYGRKDDGGEGARRRLARFALYAKRLGGTANRAWMETLLAQNAATEGLWRLGVRDKHCPDCRVQSSYGWRPLTSFPFLPGEGRTRCLVLCGCSVRTREGAESYVL